jgi:hypothetical protein
MVVPGEAGESVTARTATTPFWIRFASSPLELTPVRKHRYEPELPAQERDAPAAVAAAPGLAEMATISDAE